MANIFEDKTRSIPMDKAGENATIVRVPLTHEAIGARTSHLARADHGKNSNSIQHVKGK